MPDFHNPYNFIPTPKRQEKHDHPPVGHNLYSPRCWSGRIRVSMNTVTPLLIPDASSADENHESLHKTFPLRIGIDGRPLLAPSSVKGMLRAAYESITNSRFGVFHHDKRLARRMPAPEGLSLVPVRIEGNKIVVHQGTTPGLPTQDNAGRWTVPGQVQYAAWLPRYCPTPLMLPSGIAPQHGQEVHCWVELFQHHSWSKKMNTHVADFKFWRVRRVATDTTGLGTAPAPTSTQTDWQTKKAMSSYHEPMSSTPMKAIHGYVCIGNRNIKGKHDERVLFNDPSVTRIEIDLLDQHRIAWHDLIESYQQLHKRELELRKRKKQEYDDYLGPEPGKTAHSRHVYSDSDRDLADGMLCYARITQSNGAYKAEALYPVMISRQLNANAPSRLLDSSLLPAMSISQLSHADRVFGWVSQGSATRQLRNPVAYRGQLRIGPIACQRQDAVEDFGHSGLPLANLSAPKPQQARFYVGDSSCNPMQTGAAPGSATFGYQNPNNRLRGRKVYPFHSGLDDGYWKSPLDQGQEQREYIRVGGGRDSQNRSVRGWVRPHTLFSFDIWVTNLSKVELGALIWLLQLPTDHHLFLGGGKPLGFGAVQLAIDWQQTELRDSDAITRAFTDLDLKVANAVGEDASSTIVGYMRSMLKSYGEGEQHPEDDNGVKRLFENTGFISAFLRAASGHSDDLPTHYPRLTANPHVNGENFRWFRANEDGQRLSLGSLQDDPGLPIQV